MYQAVSEDEGATWSPMKSNHLGASVMPFCTIIPVDNGKKLLAMTNIRRPGETEEKRSNVVAQSFSERSEEHTSELQSLMRISYAVFCLKKKKHTIHYNVTIR